MPLTLRLLRPDGVEVDRRQLTGDKLGAYDETYALARDARIGTWRVELKLDPKAPAIGSVEFRVEDFVPPQLKLELSAADQPVRPGEPFPVAVAANYYYGAPGAGLAVQAQATIALDEQPFPNEPGFHFGLVDEEFAGKTTDLDAPATDDAGKSSVTLDLTDLPDLTKPLAATIRVSVFEPSGRADQRDPDPADPHAAAGDRAALAGRRRRDRRGTAGEPRHHRPRRRRQAHRREGPALGIAARELAIFLVLGQRQLAAPGAGARSAARNRRRSISPPTARRRCPARCPPGAIAGRSTDGASGAQSSLRFHVGWWVEAALPDVPDKLTATLDKATYQPGETAKLMIKAPFAGEAELAIASDRILALRSVTLPLEGATVEIPVDAAWGSGVYALVSAYRPQTAAPPGPGKGRRAGPDARSASPGSASTRARARCPSRSARPMSRGRAVPSRSGSRSPASRAARRPTSPSRRSTRRC